MVPITGQRASRAAGWALAGLILSGGARADQSSPDRQDPLEVAALHLTDADERSQGDALRVLEQAPDAEAIPLFLRLSQAPEANVRRQAVALLGQRRHPEAARRCEWLLFHEGDFGIRRTAARALAWMDEARFWSLLDLSLAAGSPSLRARVMELAWSSGLEAGAYYRQGLADADGPVRETTVGLVAGLRNPEWLPALVDRLGDNVPSVRAAAALAVGDLGAAGEAAADRLAALTRDPQANVRRGALNALGKIKAPVSLPALTGAAGDSDVTVRMEAVVSLGSFGGEGVPALVRALTDEQVGLKAVAARILKKMGHDALAAAAPALLTLLGDTRFAQEYLPFGGPITRGRGVGHEAAEALSAMGEDAVALLAPALKHPDPVVRQNAVKVIRPYHTPEALAAIILAMDDEDPKVVQEAYWGLDLHRTEETIAALAKAFKGYPLGKRLGVVQYFRRLGVIALPGLLEGIRDPESLIREYAVQGLSQAHDPKVAAALVAGLADAAIRFECARALASHQDLHAFDALAEQADRGTSQRRAQAAAALGHLGDPRAIPLLKRMVREGDDRVRRTAEDALVDLGYLDVRVLQPRP